MNAAVRSSRFIVLLLVATVLGGCAFGTRQPTLIYPPAPEADATPVARAAAKPAAKNVQIVVGAFTDQRTDKKIVGTVRNGFGMRTADVISVNSVTDWVTQAMKVELQSSGYTVTTGGAADNATGAVVSGEVLNAFCDMYISYTGQVSLLTKVSRPGKETITKHYSGEGSAGIAFGGTEESFAQSLALALAVALKQFIAELDRSLAAP